MKKTTKKSAMKQTKVRAPDTVYQATVLAGEMLRRLMNKEASVNEVKAACGIINTMQAGLHLRQEQARITGALVVGDVVPDLQFDPHATPSFQSLPAQRSLLAVAGKK